MKTYKHYLIYKITNRINGKIYIGKHKTDRLDDSYFGSGKLLKCAINKYGIENFVFHVEIDLKNQIEMDLLEQYVVNEEFLKRDDVYNISRGGKNSCMYGKSNPFFGKTHSDEFKYATSKRFKNKHITTSHKQHISDGLKCMFNDNPEIRAKCATRKNKKKCKHKITGEIKFFKYDYIPDEYELYSSRKPVHHVSNEQKQKNKEKIRMRNKQSHWYNNGETEIFCLPECVPLDYVKGRLPMTNVGRKHSLLSKHKMRLAKLGKPPSNKGKKWITDGIHNAYLNVNDPIPLGWTYGMTRK